MVWQGDAGRHALSVTPTAARRRIAIAGASGFIGQALIRALSPHHDIIALTRDATGRTGVAGVEWRSCDLFNLREAKNALKGADAAFYFVHSMMPAARLTQGRFDDLDLICADNFARAAKANALRQIIYLGGLLPALGNGQLSLHLESRLEVEQTLAAYAVPLTTLRAGLIIGAGGSSFRVMTRLIERLPLMVAPRWTSSRSQAIALEDAVRLLCFALDHPELAGRAYDIGCPDVVTYAEMLRLTGEVLGKRTRVLTLPMRTARLSTLWVGMVTGASRKLVQPLVESLQHDLVAGDGLALQRLAGVDALPLRQALQRAIDEEARRRRASVSSAPPARPAARCCVRSVQRLPLPAGRDVGWVALEYARWLPRFMRPWLRVEVNAERDCFLYLRLLRRPLLVLQFAAEASSVDRQLFFITGGILTQSNAGGRPRLEFRAVLSGRYVLAAVHDFVPRLPWFIYKYSQALLHLFVMKRFRRHLASGVARRLPQ